MRNVKPAWLLAMLIYVLPLRADEGMWLPFLLKQLNEQAMIKNGLKIPVADIYSDSQISLKDAVVIFGGGCTGEVISSNGLVLTNHHCGYGAIQALSSVGKDYLTHGYWAMNQSDELPCSGLTVTFIVSIEEVTLSVLEGVNEPMNEQERDKTIRSKSDLLIAEKIKNSHYSAFVRPFFNGNRYFLFVTEVFKDIRLAGAPPSSIGNFGGDTDNWMWPRHTGDFSLFRIYANKDNRPATYSPDNVPYKPRKHFTISLKGVKEGDFTMVYGFPGRTQQYIPSFAIDLIEQHQNPARISIRDVRLEIMEQGMKISDTVRIKYASKQKGLSNAYKKWKGELLGIRRLQTAEQKRKFENNFTEWANAAGKKEYAALTSGLKSAYENIQPLLIAADYYNEAAMGIELLSFAAGWMKWMEIPAGDTAALRKELDNRKNTSADFFKNYDARIDQRMFTDLLSVYYRNTRFDLIAPYLHSLHKKYDGNFSKMATDVFRKSVLCSEANLHTLWSKPYKKIHSTLASDPAFKLASELASHFKEKVQLPSMSLQEKLNMLNREYMAAQIEMQPDKNFYPDANFTLRVAYGKVQGYNPRDGVQYHYMTTLDGIIEKEDPKNDEFIVPAKLKQLYQQKDFGRYAISSTLPVAFTASNHTTGGNSGSPVLNAYGQLIGTNFDRVWEGTMSDLHFDPERCRNISVDIRYTLFIIEKFAGCRRLIDELTITE